MENVLSYAYATKNMAFNLFDICNPAMYFIF